MTEQNSGRGRRRAPGGRTTGPRRAPASSPTDPEEAKATRRASFGTTPRTWVTPQADDSPSTAEAPSPAPSSREGTVAGPISPQETTPSVPSDAPRLGRRAHPLTDDSANPSPSGETEARPPGGYTARPPRGRRARALAPEERDAWAASLAAAEQQEPRVHDPAPEQGVAQRAEQDFGDGADSVEPTSAGSRGSNGDLGSADGTSATTPDTSTETAKGTGTVKGTETDAVKDTDTDTAVAATTLASARSSADPDRSSAPAVGTSDDADEEGHLRRPALWTLASTLLPGTGLIPTRLRRVGTLLSAIVVITVLVLLGWFLIGNPMRALVSLATDRTVLVVILALSVVVGIIWILQIIATNLAHNTRQRLRGSKRWISLALAALMVVAVALPFGRGVQSLYAAQGLLGNQTVFSGDGDERLDGPDPWAGVGRINVLLLGQDSGADRTGTRPDTIMVASIDTETGKTALFSIPRNLQSVRFPEGSEAAEVFPDGFDHFGQNQNLINAVWTWAEDRPDLYPGDPNPGLTATTQAVEETLGLKMDYYAMVNLQGFEDLVNAIGGVEMVVERRIPIGGGTNQATGGKNKVTGYIEPGAQKLDGYQALWYARSREGSDDFNRMCRQQRMVRVVTEEANPATLALSFPKLVTATEDNIQTDISGKQLDAFVDLAMRVKGAGFTSYPITQDVTSTSDPDYDYLKEWVQASIDDSMQQAEPESVRGEEEATTAPQDGADPTAEGAEPTAEDTPEEEPTTEEESPTAGEGGDEKASEKPTIEKDPLKSCLPGYEGEETG